MVNRVALLAQPAHIPPAKTKQTHRVFHAPVVHTVPAKQTHVATVQTNQVTRHTKAMKRVLAVTIALGTYKSVPATKNTMKAPKLAKTAMQAFTANLTGI